MVSVSRVAHLSLVRPATRVHIQPALLFGVVAEGRVIQLGYLDGISSSSTSCGRTSPSGPGHHLPEGHGGILMEESRGPGSRWRSPYGWAALLLVLFLIFLAYLRDPRYSSIFDGLNLVVHEAGHLAFSYFGELLYMAGGTIFELVIPLGVGLAFYRQRDFLGMAVVLFWLGTALIHVGVYMADARSQALGLVSTGPGEPIHDWFYLLSRAGLLRQDRLLGGGIRLCGLLSMAWSLWWGGWIVKGKTEPSLDQISPG
jgi:hypothetical protein